MKQIFFIFVLVGCIWQLNAFGQSVPDRFSVNNISLETGPNPRFVWNYLNTIISRTTESSKDEVACVKDELMQTGFFKSVEPRLERSESSGGYNIVVRTVYHSQEPVYKITKIEIDEFEGVDETEFRKRLIDEKMIGQSVSLNNGYRDFENRIIEILRLSASDEMRDELPFPWFSMRVADFEGVEVRVMQKFPGCSASSN